METPILQAINISKIYQIGEDTISALHNVTLSVGRGEFLALIGKSGSGKSTLMHILGLLDTPTSGEIILNGQSTKEFDEKHLAKIRNNEIGFVFQAFNLLQRATVLENVTLPLHYSDVPRNKWGALALEKINLVGLQDRINNKSNELSGGQQQRVAIARALVNNPSIVLADEPTGNLDSKTGEEIINLFTQLNQQGKTVVVVTHDDDIARHAQRKIILRDGGTVE